MIDANRMTDNLCFYGCKCTKESILKFFDEVDTLLKTYDTQFDSLSAYKPGMHKKINRKYTNKNVHLFCEDQYAIEYGSSISAQKNWKTEYRSDYLIHVSISRGKSLISIADPDMVLSPEIIRNLLLSVGNILNASYAIYLPLQYFQSPPLYTSGCLCGQGDKLVFMHNNSSNRDELGHRFCRWGNIGMPEKVFLRGVIRDVYPLNLLCRKQIEFSMNGIPFYECVQKGIIDGQIDQISEDQYLWTIPEDKIPQATKFCDEAGFIFDDMADVPGPRVNDEDLQEYAKGDLERERNGKLIREALEKFRLHSKEQNAGETLLREIGETWFTENKSEKRDPE